MIANTPPTWYNSTMITRRQFTKLLSLTPLVSLFPSLALAKETVQAVPPASKALSLTELHRQAKSLIKLQIDYKMRFELCATGWDNRRQTYFDLTKAKEYVQEDIALMAGFYTAHNPYDDSVRQIYVYARDNFNDIFAELWSDVFKRGFIPKVYQ